MLAPPTGDFVTKSPMNNSTSKMMWSFSKSERFPKRNYQSPCNSAFYDVGKSIFEQQRSASIGYGQKFDFTKNSKKTPGPGKYDLKRDLSKISYSMGLGRNKVAIDGIKSNSSKNLGFPGPGKYDAPSMKSKIKYSFRIKGGLGLVKNNTPGPGKYPIKPTLNKSGNYTLSKYRGSGACRISSSRSSRFFTPLKNHNPAPGAYRDIGLLNKKGNYSVSNLQNSRCRSFSQAERNTMGLNLKKMRGPGPGSYMLQSEFGYTRQGPPTFGSMSNTRTKGWRSTTGSFRPMRTTKAFKKKPKSKKNRPLTTKKEQDAKKNE